MARPYIGDCGTVPKRPSRGRRATNRRSYRYQRCTAQLLSALRPSAYTSSEAEDDIPPPPPVPQSSPASPEGSFISDECYFEYIDDGQIERLPSPASTAPTSASPSPDDQGEFRATPGSPHLSTLSFEESSPERFELPCNGNDILRETPPPPAPPPPTPSSPRDHWHRKTLQTRIFSDWFAICRENPFSCCPSWVIFTILLLVFAVGMWVIVTKFAYGK